MEARDLKERAAAAYARGRYARAAQLYAQLGSLEPRNGQARLRLGDALVKAGEKGQAIEAYRAAAEMFARDGLLPRAIAASKLVLELDPTQTSVQRMLAELYAQRRAATGPRRAVSRPVAAVTPSRPAPSKPSAASSPVAAAPTRTSSATATPAPVPSRIFLPGREMGSAPPAPLPAPPIPAGLEPRRDVHAGLIAFSRFSELEMDFDVLVRMAPMAVPLNALDKAPAPTAGGAGREEGAAVNAGLGGPQPQPVPSPGEAAPAEPVAASEAGSDGDDLDFSEVTAVAEAPAEPAPAPARKRASFTELELDDTSLLNTIAAVAEAVAEEGGLRSDEEETVFSLTDTLEDEATPPPGTLPHIPLFSDLPTDAFIELFERCPLRRVREGQRAFQQGSYGDAFYVICEGAVRIVRESEGEERELAVLESGAFFGEVALLSDAPRTASVDGASDETQLLEISAPVLTELSHRYPSVAKALKKFCRERLLRTLVSTSALFRSFGKASRRKLLERFRARDVPRGHVFVIEGEETDGLYVILSGEVSVVREGQVLAHLKEGELFGEMSLLQKTPATATVTATRRTSILRLPRADFDALILTHPQALMHLAELSNARRRHTEALIGGAGNDDGAMVLI